MEQFPTPQDVTIHKRAVTRRKRETVELETRTADISTPDDLVSFMLEIATKKYRRGDRVIKFAVEIPAENFAAWANAAHISSQDLDRLDRLVIRQEVIRLARKKLRGRLAHGVFAKLEGGYASGQRLSFKLSLSVIGRS